MAFPENQVDKLARQRRAEAFARQQPGYVPPVSPGRVAPPPANVWQNSVSPSQMPPAPAMPQRPVQQLRPPLSPYSNSFTHDQRVAGLNGLSDNLASIQAKPNTAMSPEALPSPHQSRTGADAAIANMHAQHQASLLLNNRNASQMAGRGVPNLQQQRLAEQYDNVMAGQPVGSGVLPAQESRFPRQPPPNNRYQGSVPLDPSRDLSGANGLSFDQESERAFIPRGGGGVGAYGLGVDKSKFVEGTSRNGMNILRNPATGGIMLQGGGVPRTEKDTAKLMERRAALSQAYKDTRALRALDRNPQLANKPAVLDAIKRARLGPVVAAQPLGQDHYGAPGTAVTNQSTGKPFTQEELDAAKNSGGTPGTNSPQKKSDQQLAEEARQQIYTVGGLGIAGLAALSPKVRSFASGVGSAVANRLPKYTGVGGIPFGFGQKTSITPITPAQAAPATTQSASLFGVPSGTPAYKPPAYEPFISPAQPGPGSSPQPTPAPAATPAPAPAVSPSPAPTAQVPASSTVAGTKAAQAMPSAAATPAATPAPSPTQAATPAARPPAAVRPGGPLRERQLDPPVPATPENPVPPTASVANAPAAKSSPAATEVPVVQAPAATSSVPVANAPAPLTSKQSLKVIELMSSGMKLEDATAQVRSGAKPSSSSATQPVAVPQQQPVVNAAAVVSPERMKAIENTLSIAGGDPAKVEEIFKNRNKVTNGSVPILNQDELSYVRSKAVSPTASTVPPSSVVSKKKVNNAPAAAPTTVAGGVTPQRQAELDAAALVEADLRKRGELPANPPAGEKRIGITAEGVPVGSLGEKDTAGVQVKKTKAETPLAKQARQEAARLQYDTPEKRRQFIESKNLTPGKATTMAWRKEFGIEPEFAPLKVSTGSPLDDTRAKINSLPPGDPAKKKLESLLKLLESRQPSANPQPNRSGKIAVPTFPTMEQKNRALGRISDVTPTWMKGAAKGGVNFSRGVGGQVALDAALQYLENRFPMRQDSLVNQAADATFGRAANYIKPLLPQRPDPTAEFYQTATQDDIARRRLGARAGTTAMLPSRQALQPPVNDQSLAEMFARRVGRYPSSIEFARFKATGATPTGGF